MRQLITPLFLLLSLGAASACATGAKTSEAASRSSRTTPITMDEISQAGMPNAYDLVQALRPIWLSRQGAQTSPADEIIVYMDDTRLGGLAALRQISSGNVVSVQYLDARASQFRWGAGHPQGVILVTTRK